MIFLLQAGFLLMPLVNKHSLVTILTHHMYNIYQQC